MFIIIYYNQIIGDYIMLKWMSRVAANRGKSLLPSTIITLAIVVMLIISGPAQAVAVVISGLDGPYMKGESIDFQVKIEINDPDKYVPITNISLDLNGPVRKETIFDLNGKRISGDHNITIEPVSNLKKLTKDFGYGYGYGLDNQTGYGYNFGYGYGYGSGKGKISVTYDVSIKTKYLPVGTYTVMTTLNTGQNVAFSSSQFSFELKQTSPGMILNATVEIKPETLNLASKGEFTAFITSDEFEIADINGSTVKVTCEGCNIVHAINWNLADNKFIAKFRTQDLEDVHTGNAVKFTVTGELSNGAKFEGSDTVKVINQGKNQKEVEECECDEHVKEHDHEDECDEEHDHEDECDEEHNNDDEEHDHQGKQVKNNSPEKYKKDVQKNNNGGQVKNVIVNNNNININNNSGTININIYNQGSGTAVNQGSNDNIKKQNKGNKRANSNNNKNKNNKNGKGED